MPQAKTCILRSTNTSFKLLEMYLLQLQTSGLLELQEKTRKYTTTNEGQRFIETWVYLKTMVYPQAVPVLTHNKKRTVYNHLTAIPIRAPIT